MIFITGPMYSGKADYARSLCSGDKILLNAHELAADASDLSALADALAARYAVITAAETGGGVVPIDPAQRAAREAAGRLACLLAAKADTVVRVFCGIPTAIKGDLP